MANRGMVETKRVIIYCTSENTISIGGGGESSNEKIRLYTVRGAKKKKNVIVVEFFDGY